MTRIRVIAVVTAVAALTGCARPADMQTAAAPAAAAPTGPEILADIISQLYGTAEQREAGHERQFYAWQAALGACMVGKGATFEVPAYTPVSFAGAKIGPGDILAFSPQRTDFALAERTVQAAKVGNPSNPALLRLTGEQAEAWVRTQMECEPATKATEELALPEGKVALGVNLQNEMIKLQDELAPGLGDRYRTCMSAAGVPADDLPDVMNIAGQKYPPVTSDQPSDPTKLPGWAAAVTFERQLAAADWRCRGDDATRVINASGARLAVWADQHKAELAAVAAAWARMPAERDTAKAAALKVATK